MSYVQVHLTKKFTAWNRLAMQFGPFVDSFSFLSKFIALQSLIPPTTFSIKSLIHISYIKKKKFRYIQHIWKFDSICFQKRLLYCSISNIYYAHLNCQVLAVIATMINWRTKKNKQKTENSPLRPAPLFPALQCNLMTYDRIPLHLGPSIFPFFCDREL